MLRRVMMAQPAASGGTDNFSSNTIAQYTQYADTNANWAISGGTLSASSGAQSVLTRNGVSFADGEVSCVITQANDAGLAVRLADKDNYYLAVIYDNSVSTPTQRSRVRLYKRVSGTFTEIVGLTPIPTFVRGVQTKLALDVNGTSITVSVNDVVYISTTDSSLAAPGKCGPRSTSTIANIFDSFSWP